MLLDAYLFSICFLGHWQAYTIYTLAGCQLFFATLFYIIWNTIACSCYPLDCILMLMFHPWCKVFHVPQQMIAKYDFHLSTFCNFPILVTSHFLFDLCVEMEMKSFTFWPKIPSPIALVTGSISVNFNFPFIANWYERIGVKSEHWAIITDHISILLVW